MDARCHRLTVRSRVGTALSLAIVLVLAAGAADAAVKLMEEKRLLNLPVKKNGKVAYCVTRHDLLRAWIGLGLDIENTTVS